SFILEILGLYKYSTAVIVAAAFLWRLISGWKCFDIDLHLCSLCSVLGLIPESFERQSTANPREECQLTISDNLHHLASLHELTSFGSIVCTGAKSNITATIF